MRLFRTEISRFWSRKIVWAAATVLALIFVAGAVIGFFRTSSDFLPKEAAIQECIVTESGYSESIQSTDVADYCRESGYNRFQRDRRFWAKEILHSGSGEIETVYYDEGPGYSADEYSITDLNKNPLQMVEPGFKGIIPNVAIPLLVVMTLLGASFIGAEFRSGTVENLLLWEPRRWKVLGTKYLAGGASAAIFMAVALSLLTALLVLLATLHGTFEGTDASFWLSLAGVISRSSGLAFLAFIFAMAIATITRYTAAAVVVLLGWTIVSNILVETFFSGFRRWELITNSQAFVKAGDVPQYLKSWCEKNGEEFYCNSGSQGWFQETVGHSYLTGGLVALLWATIPAVIAIIVFRKRDVS